MAYQVIGENAFRAIPDGDYRGAADQFLRAVKKAPTKNAKKRYEYYFLYTMILRELHFDATKSELKYLKKSFLDNDEEPPHFRVSAAFCLGVVYTIKGDKELAGEVYRVGISVAQAMTKEEGELMVSSDEGDKPASFFVETTCETLRENRNTLMGRGSTTSDFQDLVSEVRSDGTPVPNVGRFEKLTFTQDNSSEMAENNLLERLREVGGEKCDFCGKSRQEAGLEHLFVCARCRKFDYCSKSCQKAAWKAGHKQACRKPKQIEIGDYMKLADLARNELNGELVKVLGRQEAAGRKANGEEEEQRLKVEILSTRQNILVLPSKLKHIRPAK